MNGEHVFAWANRVFPLGRERNRAVLGRIARGFGRQRAIDIDFGILVVVRPSSGSAAPFLGMFTVRLSQMSLVFHGVHTIAPGVPSVPNPAGLPSTWNRRNPPRPNLPAADR